MDLDQRHDYVREVWRNLYKDYCSYIDDPSVRATISEAMATADPEDLLTNWTFVLFSLANLDFRSGHTKSERDFVVAMQTAGIVAYDPERCENVYLHTA